MLRHSNFSPTRGPDITLTRPPEGRTLMHMGRTTLEQRLAVRSPHAAGVGAFMPISVPTPVARRKGK